MIRRSKGRIEPETELVTSQEAARILGVPLKALQTLVKKGVVEPLEGDDRQRRFHLSDLSAIAQALSKKMDLATIGNLVLKALTIATRADRKVNYLYEVLGLHVKDLPLEEAPALALYGAAREALIQERFSAPEVLEWGRTFLALSEEYLKILELYTGSEEPWKVFMDLGQHLASVAPVDFGVNKDLEEAYIYLRAARRHLRQVSYFSARAKVGARKANKLFADPEMDVSDAIINLLFPR